LRKQVTVAAGTFLSPPERYFWLKPARHAACHGLSKGCQGVRGLRAPVRATNTSPPLHLADGKFSQGSQASSQLPMALLVQSTGRWAAPGAERGTPRTIPSPSGQLMCAPAWGVPAPRPQPWQSRLEARARRPSQMKMLLATQQQLRSRAGGVQGCSDRQL